MAALQLEAAAVDSPVPIVLDGANRPISFSRVLPKHLDGTYQLQLQAAAPL